jgi:four helix bundle protein
MHHWREPMSDCCFDHERLDVYRVAIEFTAWAGELLDGPLANCKLSAVNQLDRASTSTPLNIAEGNGKRSAKDRCRYLDTSRGSSFECAAALDVLVARKRLKADQIAPGKALLRREVEMLSKLTAKLLGQDLAAAARQSAVTRQ